MRIRPRSAKIHSKILKTLAVFALIATSANASGTIVCSDLFRPIPEVSIRVFAASHTLSQRIRDNAHDYWHFSRQHGESFFGKLIQHQGIVVGDTHPGNFVFAPFNGSMRFFIADIKDAGVAPYILDFSRLVLSSHAAIRDYDVSLVEVAKILFESYEKGLRGEEPKVPGKLQPYFKITSDEFAYEQAGFVRKYLKDGRFKFKRGKIEKLEKHFDAATLSQLKSEIIQNIGATYFGARTLDMAFRPRDRGGSKDMERYWALIEVNGQKRIIEFKEIGDPATSFFGPQNETQQRYKNVMSTFWGELDPTYAVTKILGRDFFMRPKKYEVIEVPYRQHSKSDLKTLLQLAAYDAFYLGTLHGRQSNGAEYRTGLQAIPAERLINRVVSVSETYRERLIGEIERLQNE